MGAKQKRQIARLREEVRHHKGSKLSIATAYADLLKQTRAAEATIAKFKAMFDVDVSTIDWTNPVLIVSIRIEPLLFASFRGGEAAYARFIVEEIIKKIKAERDKGNIC